MPHSSFTGLCNVKIIYSIVQRAWLLLLPARARRICIHPSIRHRRKWVVHRSFFFSLRFDSAVHRRTKPGQPISSSCFISLSLFLSFFHPLPDHLLIARRVSSRHRIFFLATSPSHWSTLTRGVVIPLFFFSLLLCPFHADDVGKFLSRDVHLPATHL